MIRNNKRFFSLIEIVLAIAIIAIGCASIMALFPAGLIENRKAIVQNNAANSAESIFAYISNQASSASNLITWQSFVNSFPNNKPASVLEGADILEPVQFQTEEDGSPKLDANEDKIVIGNIYDSEDNKGIYAIKLKTGKHNDMIGEVLIWIDEVKKTYFGKTLISSGLGTDNIIGVNIELSFPVEKPYSTRDKFQYYFEIFNKNSEATQPDTPLFDEGDGYVTVNYKSRISVEVLGTFFAYSNNYKAKVYLQLEVTEPDGTVTVSTPFNNGSYLSYRNSNITITPTVYTQDVEAGTQFRISAMGQGVYDSDKNRFYGPYWSDNSTQADALVDGQVPFPYSPAGSQPGFSTFIKQYVNESTGQVTIEDYEILFLFELNSVPKSHKSYDMQDMIVLAGIAKIEISPAEAAALATKEVAFTALQDVETALSAAIADKASKLSALNQVKKSVNYNTKKGAESAKHTAYNNALNNYNNHQTNRNLRRRNRKKIKWDNALAVLNAAELSIATEQSNYDITVTAYGNALNVLDNAQTAYDNAVAAYDEYL